MSNLRSRPPARAFTAPYLPTSARHPPSAKLQHCAIFAVIDVSSHIQIRLPREEVGAFTLNLDNARKWVGSLRSVEWITPPPLAVRSRIGLVTEVFGRRVKVGYEIVSLVPAERLVMRAERPFPMEMRYILESLTAASTRITVRGRADLGGFLNCFAPMIAGPLRESYRDDLLRLKKILERERPTS
jgi:Polyketide cyclase / dehydrase and lipid transport